MHAVCQAITVSLQAGHAFLLGAIPSNADFAIYGQLRQLAVDPYPALIVRAYPAVWGWVWTMDDLSGFEPQAGPGAMLHCITPGAVAMLLLCDRAYIPFLAANAHALQMNAPEVRVSISVSSVQEPAAVAEIVSTTHVQPPFKYQARCLANLQAQWQRLDSEEMRQLSLLLPECTRNPNMLSPSGAIIAKL